MQITQCNQTASKQNFGMNFVAGGKVVKDSIDCLPKATKDVFEAMKNDIQTSHLTMTLDRPYDSFTARLQDERYPLARDMKNQRGNSLDKQDKFLYAEADGHRLKQKQAFVATYEILPELINEIFAGSIENFRANVAAFSEREIKPSHDAFKGIIDHMKFLPEAQKESKIADYIARGGISLTDGPVTMADIEKYRSHNSDIPL